MTRTTAAVIGANGFMGSFFADLFERAGHRVLRADRSTNLTPTGVAQEADIVLIAVPIDATEQIIRDTGPLLRADAVLMDVTSIKAEPVAAMLSHASCEVIGLHPMFGRGTRSLKGEVVVFCPARAPTWTRPIRDLLAEEGAQIVEATPDEHDRAMAVVQVLRHCVTIAMGHALASLGVDPHDSLQHASPIYRLELIMTARLFAQRPELYADIAMRNPESERVLSAFQGALRTVSQQVESQDREAFIAAFQNTAKHFGAFTDASLDESTQLLEILRQRSATDD